MKFTNEFKQKGTWWTPERKDAFVYGELSYDLTNGINLKVYSSLVGSKSIYTSKSNFLISTIRGLTKEGHNVTLINSFGHETGSNNLLETTLKVEYAVFSTTHFLEPEVDKFDKISIHLNCNDAFFVGLYKTLKIDGFDKDGDIESLRHEKTPSKLIFKDDEIESQLFFSHGFNYSSPGENEFKFSQSVFINSAIKKSFNFSESIRFSKIIKSLFVFFVEANIFFNYLRVKEQKSGIIFDVIFHQPNRNSFQSLQVIDLLCRYNDFEGSFESAFSWFMKNRDFIETGLSLYLQLRELKIESIPQRFLSIVFALETLHTTFFSKNPFTNEDENRFKSQKKDFIIDEIFKKKFNECLLHFNTQSFADRIDNFIEINSEIISEYIYDKKDFTIKIKNQRNYFAHNHTSTNHKLIKQEDFGYFIQVCRIIFEVSFLELIGIKKHTIKKCIQSNFFNNYYKKKMPQLNQ